MGKAYDSDIYKSKQRITDWESILHMNSTGYLVAVNPTLPIETVAMSAGCWRVATTASNQLPDSLTPEGITEFFAGLGRRSGRVITPSHNKYTTPAPASIYKGYSLVLRFNTLAIAPYARPKSWGA